MFRPSLPICNHHRNDFECKGSIGKFVKDDTLYERPTRVDKLDKIVSDLNDGKGSAGKFLKDESLYKNLNETVANTNQLVAEINAGKGSLGKLAKDKEFAQKLDDTVTRLDAILTSVNEGKGTVGQLLTNRSLYDNADQTLDEAHQLVKGMRENPKKYLVIQLKIFKRDSSRVKQNHSGTCDRSNRNLISLEIPLRLKSGFASLPLCACWRFVAFCWEAVSGDRACCFAQ